MTSDVSDILSSKTIPELRDLVTSLNIDAVSKREELQLMVGSKYHDFIQSADAIASMCDGTTIMASKLTNFKNGSDQLLETMKELLDKIMHDRKPSLNIKEEKKVTEKMTLSDLSDKTIWKHLNVCDVFKASQLVIASLLLTGDSTSVECIESCLSLESISSFMKTLSRNSVKQVQGATVLRNTVIDDAWLSLLIPNQSPKNQARVLATLRILQNLQEEQLFSDYLVSVKTKLEDVVDQVYTSYNENDVHKNAAFRANRLLSYLSSLQKVIMDIYFIFFSEKGNYVQQQQLCFLEDLNDIFTNFSGSDKVIGVAKFKTSLISQNHSQTREQFDVWVASAVQRIVALSDEALGSMQTAVEVAQLQNKVWRCSTFQIEEDSGVYTADDWFRASKALLAPVSQKRSRFLGSQSVTEEKEQDDPKLLLWATALRRPFLNQVERLLRNSCQLVLQNVKFQVFQVLQAEGILVDQHSLKPYGPLLSSENTAGKGKGLNSASIFRKAEFIRNTFEDELTSMLMDIRRDPSHKTGLANDPQSSKALNRALFVQCSHLMGHFAIFIRNLFNEFLSTYKARHSTTECKYEDAGMTALASSILIMGRLAWSFRSKGEFLQSISFLNSSSDSEGTENRFDLSSEDQLRSAFEIADANGDAVLTMVEAVEAIQAISVSEKKEIHMDDGGMMGNKQYPYLSNTLTPSLTFSELAMLCTHLLASDSCAPLSKFSQCMDDLATQAHDEWINIVTNCGEAELVKELRNDYILGKFPKNSFKGFWRSVEIDGGDKSEIPTACSSSLTKYFFEIHLRVIDGLFSIDSTLNLLPSSIASQLHLQFHCTESKNGKTKLIGVVMDRLHPLSINKLASCYEEILNELQEIDTGIDKKFRQKQNWLENCALQMLFDLKVIENMYSNHISGKFKSSMNNIKSVIDPINAELVMPFLDRQVLKHILESHLLSPLEISRGFGKSNTIKKEDFNATESLFAYKQASDGNSSTCPKFAVLPLAITHHSMMSKDLKISENESIPATSENSEKNTGFRTTSDVLEQSNEQGFGKYFGFLS